MNRIVFVALIVLVWAAFHDEVRPLECKASSKVDRILELQYRSAVILLQNGRKEHVSQARLKVGDDYCYEYGRREK